MSEAGELLSPRNNPHLVGHEAAERRFLEAWESGRLAHAWLISGPRGVGKAMLAFRIARFVLAGGGEQGMGLFGAPVRDGLAIPADDPVFRRVASGGHADLRVIERDWADAAQTRKKTEISAEQARILPEFLSMTPAEGGWRVVIVDAVDELNRYGANALLKPLEEPPQRTLMLLVCHAPGEVLPTIRSRCRQLRLSPLTDETVAGLVQRYRPNVDAAQAGELARLGEGSIGRALAFDSGGGLELHHDLERLLSSLPRLDIPALHAFADRAGKSDDTLRLTSELLSGWLADRATGRVNATAQQGGLERWVELWEKSRRSFELTDALNLDRKQMVLNLFFALEKEVRSASGAAGDRT